MAIGIYGQFDCRTTDGVIAVAEQIKDTELGKFQSEINAELYEAVDGIAGSSAITELGDRVTAVENAVDAKAEVEDVTALDGRVDAVENAVETKADADAVYSKTDADGKFATKSSVDTLSGAVATKADASALATLSNTVNSKANTSDLTALRGRVDDVEGKAETNAEAIGNMYTKAEVDDKVATTNNKVASLTTAVGNKANASDLTTLENTVANKANASDLTALETTVDTLSGTVATKADASALTTLENTVNSKASTSALNELANTVNSKANTSALNTLSGRVDTAEGDIATLETVVNGKASTSALSALENTVANKADTSALNELTDVVDGKVDDEDLTAENVALDGWSGNNITNVKQALDVLLDAKYYVSPSITSFSCGVGNQEVGQRVTALTFTWSCNKTMETRSINQGVGVVTSSPKAYTPPTPITSNITFTLTVSDGRKTATRSSSIYFYQRMYWFVDAADSVSNERILQATQSALMTSQSVRSGERTFDCSGKKYIYICIPTNMTSGIDFQLGGLPTPVVTVQMANFVNQHGAVVPMTIYRSLNQLGGSEVKFKTL